MMGNSKQNGGVNPSVASRDIDRSRDSFQGLDLFSDLPNEPGICKLGASDSRRENKIKQQAPFFTNKCDKEIHESGIKTRAVQQGHGSV